MLFSPCARCLSECRQPWRRLGQRRYACAVFFFLESLIKELLGHRDNSELFHKSQASLSTHGPTHASCFLLRRYFIFDSGMTVPYVPSASNNKLLETWQELILGWMEANPDVLCKIGGKQECNERQIGAPPRAFFLFSGQRKNKSNLIKKMMILLIIITDTNASLE